MGKELVAGGQFFSAWFSFFVSATVPWTSLLALSFSWPNLYFRYKMAMSFWISFLGAVGF